MTIEIDQSYNWKSNEYLGAQLSWIGDKDCVESLAKIISQDAGDIGKIKEGLNQQCKNNPSGFFSLIYESKDYLLAVVDRCACYPIYYGFDVNSYFHVSNNVRSLRDQVAETSLDPISALEMCCAGYVTGTNTIYPNIFQIQAGCFIVWNKRLKRLQMETFFRYFPENSRDENTDSLLDELEGLTDRCSESLIEPKATRLFSL